VNGYPSVSGLTVLDAETGKATEFLNAMRRNRSPIEIPGPFVDSSVGS
jgi:hypothetical protein